MADVERLLLGSRFPPNFLDSFSVIGGRNSKNYMNKTKTSIRYAKENDREKRERRREKERKVEGEI
jgi:hypothetical protein